MEYRARLTIVNDDETPSPESVAHIIRHRLRDDGLIGATVEVSDATDVHPHETDTAVQDGHPHGTGTVGLPQAGPSAWAAKP